LTEQDGSKVAYLQVAHNERHVDNQLASGKAAGYRSYG